MRALAVAAAAALLAGCVVVPARSYQAGPPPPAVAPAQAPASVPAPPSGISERDAVEIAFRIAHERGLAVDRVKHVHLDGRGRWHVELRGHHDRARVLLGARDGRVLRASFKDDDRGFDD